MMVSKYNSIFFLLFSFLLSFLYQFTMCFLLHSNHLFNNWAPLGQVGLVYDVHVYIYLCIYMSPSHAILFQGLSLTLRPHDQFKTSHW